MSILPKRILLAACLLFLAAPVLAVETITVPLDCAADFNWGYTDSVVVLSGSPQVPAQEPWTDWNPDGHWGLYSDPFTDRNSNGVWDCCLTEWYTDANGNGQYDQGEPHGDDWDGDGRYDVGYYAEPYVDRSGNHVYDFNSPEPYTDLNGDGAYTSPLVLSIAPGTIVKFPHSGLYYGHRLTVDGRILLSPAPAKPVVFTSYRDDSYGGDTDGNGPTVGIPEDWGYVAVSSDNTMQNCIFRYGGKYQGIDALLEVGNAGSVSVLDCRFEQFTSRSIYVHNATGTVAVERCTVAATGATGAATFAQCGSLVTIRACDFISTSANAIAVRVTDSSPLFENNVFSGPVGSGGVN